MAEPKPARRRITPVLVTSPQPPAAQPALDLQTQAKAELDHEEQARLAEQHLGPGRRIRVSLADSNVVNWRKLLKARGALPSANKTNTLPSQPGDIQEVQARGTTGMNVLNSVIHRLEQAYVLHQSDSDSDLANGEEPSTDPVGSPAGSEDGEERGGNDTYDLDDAFIDDSEYIEYYEGDRRKPKHAGFFINKGDIEKQDGVVKVAPSPVPRKKRKKLAESNDALHEEPAPRPAKANGSSAQKPAKRKAASDGEPAEPCSAKRQKVLLNGSGDKPAKRAKAKKSLAAANQPLSQIPEHQPLLNPLQPPAFARPEPAGLSSIAALAAAAGAQAGTAAPAAPIPSSPSASQLHPSLATHSTESPGSGLAPTASHASTFSTADTALGQKPGTTPGTSSRPAKQRSASRGPAASSQGDAAAPFEVPRELLEAIDALRRACQEAALVPAPPPKPGDKRGPHKRMPKAVLELMPHFAVLFYRLLKDDKEARKRVVSDVMAFMEPYTTRSNLLVRLKSEWDRLASDVAAKKEAIAARLGAVSQRSQGAAGGSDDDFVDPEPGGFLAQGASWSPELEDLVYDYVIGRLQMKGGSLQGAKGGRICMELAELWQPGQVDESVLRGVCKRVEDRRGCEQGKPAAAQPPQPQAQVQHQEQQPQGPAPAIAAAAPGVGPGSQGTWLTTAFLAQALKAPTVSATDTLNRLALQAAAVPATSTPAAAQNAAAASALPVADLVAPVRATLPSGHPQHQQPAVLAAVPMPQQPVPQHQQPDGPATLPGSTPKDPQKAAEESLSIAVSMRGDPVVLDASLKACALDSHAGIVTQVLMHAGPAGLTAREIIEKAWELGLLAQRWKQDRYRMGCVVADIKDAPHLVHIGKNRYAHTAFPGVVEVPRAHAAKMATVAGAGISQQRASSAEPAAPKQEPASEPSAAAPAATGQQAPVPSTSMPAAPAAAAPDQGAALAAAPAATACPAAAPPVLLALMPAIPTMGGGGSKSTQARHGDLVQPLQATTAQPTPPV